MTTIRPCAVCGDTELPRGKGNNKHLCNVCKLAEWKARRDKQRKLDPMYGRSQVEKDLAAKRGATSEDFHVTTPPKIPERTPGKRWSERHVKEIHQASEHEEDRILNTNMPYLKSLDRVIDDKIVTRKMIEGGFVYVGYYGHLGSHWIVTGRAQSMDRVRSYNTYSPHRDFNVVLKIASTNRAEAEKWLQSILDFNCEKRGTPSATGKSEWFYVNSYRWVCSCLRDMAQYQPWYVDAEYDG